MLNFVFDSPYSAVAQVGDPDFPVQVRLVRRQWDWAWFIEFWLPDFFYHKDGWHMISNGEESWHSFAFRRDPKPKYLFKAIQEAENELVYLFVDLTSLAAAQKVALASGIEPLMWAKAALWRVNQIQKRRIDEKYGPR